MRAMRTAATGLVAQQRNIDVIANNLANVNTTGFKRSRAEFVDLLYQQIREPGTVITRGTRSPVGIQIGHGVRLAGTSRSMSVGNMIETQGLLDVVLADSGTARSFFQVQLQGGRIGYTRDGKFKINDVGELVTSTGLKLQPPISGIPTDALDVTIDPSGQVTYRTVNSTTNSLAGQIEIATFVNPNGLRAQGGNIFIETPASGLPQKGNPNTNEFPELLAGFLEGSNVQAVEELVGLIVAQRTYEMNSKVIQASDEILQTTANLRR